MSETVVMLRMPSARLQQRGRAVVGAGLGRGGRDGAVGVALQQAVAHQLRDLQHPAHATQAIDWTCARALHLHQ